MPQNYMPALPSAVYKLSALNLQSVAAFSAVTAGGIASGTYNTSTGIIALTFSVAPFGAGIGSTNNNFYVTIAGITGTGNGAQVNGTWPITGTATSGTVVSLQGPKGLGASTLTTTSGTLAAGGGATNFLIKASRGRIGRLYVNQAGTAGSWTVYDTADNTAGNFTNTIFTAAFGVAGVATSTMSYLDFPCINGIVLLVPVGGIASLSYN